MHLIYKAKRLKIVNFNFKTFNLLALYIRYKIRNVALQAKVKSARQVS